MKLDDLTGRSFGRLSVIERAETNSSGRSRWRCICSCGETTTVISQSLVSGRSKSCGCLNSEMRKVGGGNKSHKHLMCNSPTYSSWVAMRKRCSNPGCNSYEIYGGNGIAVCDRWISSFENFFSDMGERPKGASIDRIDPSKGYFPGNCRWATNIEQSRNRSSNRHVEYKGKTFCVSELAEHLGMNKNTLLSRILKGIQLDIPVKTRPKKESV